MSQGLLLACFVCFVGTALCDIAVHLVSDAAWSQLLQTPRHACAAEVLNTTAGGMTLPLGVAPLQRANVSMITRRSVALPYQPSQQMPVELIYRGFFNSSFREMINLLNQSSLLPDAARASVELYVLTGTASVPPLAIVVQMCVVLCMGSTDYPTQRGVVVSRSKEPGLYPSQYKCLCTGTDQIAALSQRLSSAFDSRLHHHVPPTAALLEEQSNMSVAVDVEFYCAAAGVAGRICNDGCQLRGAQRCCYPGTFTVMEVKYDSDGLEDTDDSSDDDDEIIMVLVVVVTVWILESVIYCTLTKTQKSGASSRRSLSKLESVLEPRSDAECDLLADTLLNQHYSLDRDEGEADEAEMRFLFSEMRRSASGGTNGGGDGASDTDRIASEQTQYFADDILNDLLSANPSLVLREDSTASSTGALGARAAAVSRSGHKQPLLSAGGMHRGAYRNAAQQRQESGTPRYIPPTVSSPAARGRAVDAEVGRDTCPVCLEVMGTVVAIPTQVVVLPCGHRIHRSCFKQYLKHKVKSREDLIKCPIFKCEHRVDAFEHEL